MPDYGTEFDWQQRFLMTPGPTVDVTAASIPNDDISVVLEPPGGSGLLVVQVVGTTTHTVFEDIRPGGGHSISFNIPNLPNGHEFTEVRAIWHVAGSSPQDTHSYRFKVLGDYTHTRYNTPTESFCSGNLVDMAYVSGTCSVVQNCNFTGFQGKSGWWSEVHENGSGLSETIGVVSREWFCTGPERRTRRVPDPCPQCGGTLSVGSSVARNVGNGDLECDATLYVHQVGVVKVVDAGALAMDQLDHYAGFSGCNRTAGTIGIRKTLRLF